MWWLLKYKIKTFIEKFISCRWLLVMCSFINEHWAWQIQFLGFRLLTKCLKIITLTLLSWFLSYVLYSPEWVFYWIYNLHHKLASCLFCSLCVYITMGIFVSTFTLILNCLQQACSPPFFPLSLNNIPSFIFDLHLLGIYLNVSHYHLTLLNNFFLEWLTSGFWSWAFPSTLFYWFFLLVRDTLIHMWSPEQLLKSMIHFFAALRLAVRVSQAVAILFILFFFSHLVAWKYQPNIMSEFY